MPTAAQVATLQRAPTSVATCDEALRLLRVARRQGDEEQRELVQLAIDDLLDRRLELTEEERT